jgi:hypothetical protein
MRKENTLARPRPHAAQPMATADPRRPPTAAVPTGRRRCLGVALAALLSGCAGVTAQAGDAAPVVQRVDVAGATLELQFAPGFTDALQRHALAWVQRSAAAVAAYFGRFPLPQVELLLVPVPGDAVQGGVSYALPSPLVRIRLGVGATAEQLDADWILVHEMVHLGVPRVARAHNWLHEGIATYVEALARGHAGLVRAEDVWQAWARTMPHGLPQPGESGLDHTPTWARTYWGGALFALLADVRMRQRGTTTRGLQHALQGVLAAGGDYRVAWPLTRVLATADAAVGQHTLTELYEQMKDHAVNVDLPALWRDLGVGQGALNDAAPLAAVRRAILS